MNDKEKKKRRGAPAGLVVFIAILFVIIAVLGLLGFNIWRVLFNSELVKSALTEEVTNTDIVPSTMELFSQWRAEQRVENNESLSGVNEPDIVLLVSFMEASDWKEVRQLLITDDLVEEIISVSVDGFYRWIDSDDAVPDIVWNLAPLKQRIIGQEGIDAIMVAYNRMPEATEEQIEDFKYRLSQVPPGVEVLYNLAQFPEPWYEDQVNDYIDAFHDVGENIPSKFDVSELINTSMTEQTALQTKALLRLVRLIAMAAWIVALVLLLLIIALKVRSIKSLGLFVGIPLLITGIIGAAIALVVQPMIIGFVSSGLLMGTTDFAQAEIAGTLHRLSSLFFKPLLIESAVVGGMGILFIILISINYKKSTKT